MRFSICDSSAAENPVISASCWSETPRSSRNFRMWSPTCTSGSPAAGPQSPDSSAIFESRSSSDSSRVISGKGFPLLQGGDVERNELLIFLRDDLGDAVEQRPHRHHARDRDVCAQGDHRGELLAPDELPRDVVGRNRQQLEVLAVDLRGADERPVDHEGSPFPDQREILLQGRAVHDDAGLRMADHGRPDLVVGDDDRAIRGPPAHLDPVGGEIGDVPSLLHRRERQEVPDHENPLAPEARHDDVGAHRKSACLRSLYTPSGKYSDISPSTRFWATSGFIPHLVAQVDRNSTIENPISLSCISNAFLTASFAFRICAGVLVPTRAEYAVPSKVASSSAILIGYPSF